jgi:hypothetical protein
MGRSYDKIETSSPQSEDYHSPHSRKLIPRAKKYSRHQERQSLQKCDPELYTKKETKFKDYQKLNNIQKFNIPNNRFTHYDDILNGDIYKGPVDDMSTYDSRRVKWQPEDGNLIERIDTFLKTENIFPSDQITTNQKNSYKRYLTATKKQIERRGAAKFFKGHLREFKDYYAEDI